MPGYLAPPTTIVSLNQSDLSEGIALAMPMTEPTKDMLPVDYSGRNISVTYASAKISPVNSALGWCRYFPDSVGDVIDFGSEAYLTSGEPFTISFIISPGSTSSNDAICKFKTSGSYGFLVIVSSLAGYGPLCFGQNAFGRIRVDDSGLLAILQNGLPHIGILAYGGGAATSASSYRCKVDGVEYPLVSSSTLGNPTNENLIGGQSGGNAYDGTIQNIVVWEREFDDNQMASHFLDSFGIYREEDVSEWLGAALSPPSSSLAPIYYQQCLAGM